VTPLVPIPHTAASRPPDLGPRPRILPGTRTIMHKNCGVSSQPTVIPAGPSRAAGGCGRRSRRRVGRHDTAPASQPPVFPVVVLEGFAARSARHGVRYSDGTVGNVTGTFRSRLGSGRICG